MICVAYLLKHWFSNFFIFLVEFIFVLISNEDTSPRKKQSLLLILVVVYFQILQFPANIENQRLFQYFEQLNKLRMFCGPRFGNHCSKRL